MLLAIANPHIINIKVKLVINIINRLYRERITQIESKLTEVRTGKAAEYLHPLEELQDNMKNRMEVGAILRELRLQNIKCKYDAEQIANEQNFKVSIDFIYSTPFALQLKCHEYI